MTDRRERLIAEAEAQIDAFIAYRRRSLCAHPIKRDISLPQLHILMTLQERGATMVSDLATALQISTPSASSIVDRMEQHNLVQRVRDETDRRVVHVMITEHGRTIAEEMIGLHREQVGRLLDTMTDEELQHVVHGLKAVHSGITRVSGSKGVSALHAGEPMP
jgi:DNA-binding MarR family transcriptional regulator